jgi:hypothetical protein
MKITYDMVWKSSGIEEYCVDASDLGLAPGAWPMAMNTSMGNELPFVLDYQNDAGHFVYKQAGGCVSLLVFND